MEQAIFITKTENLKYWDEKYTILYFGIEFCETLIPIKDDLKEIIEFCDEKNINFTFVTPYVTDLGLNKLKPLLNDLNELNKEIEVVVNDFGVLDLINNKYTNLKPVLGRLLSKQKKGPRILNIKDKLPKEAWEHFQSSNVDIDVMQNFLVENKVKRVELDNLIQGVKVELRKVKGSLYYPYVNVTTTRLCLTNGCDKRLKPKLGIHPCEKECQEYTFKLTNKDMPVTILLKGNSQFFRNDKLPENLEEMGIDRLIFEPEIPI